MINFFVILIITSKLGLLQSLSKTVSYAPMRLVILIFSKLDIATLTCFNFLNIIIYFKVAFN